MVSGATLLPVSFSAGGSGPLARLSDGTRRLSMTWAGASLPVPVLSGATATYEDVLPGVDLRMTALPQGFSEVLVIESAQAATNPALVRLAFDLDVAGATLGVAEDGGVQAVDATGAVVFTSPRAMMWDTADTPVSEQAAVRSATVATGGRATPRFKAMGESLTGTRLTVAPDPGFLTDPATRYPVYIDPTFTGGRSGNAWAVVASRSDLAGSKFWQTTFMSNSGTFGDAGSGLTCDSYSGNTCTSTTYRVRSLFRMETYGAAGAAVISSNFEITQKWSWTCNTASDAKLWVIGAFNSNTTWNNQPSWDGNHTATAPGNHAVGSVNGCTGAGTVSFDTTSMVQYAFSQGWGDLNLGLQAVSEGSNLQWKRFDSSTAVLHIRYDHAPDVPALSDLKIGPTGLTSCGLTAGAPMRVNTTNGLTLNAVLSDPDAGAGDLVKAEWAVTGVAAQYVPAAETAGLVSGSNHQATIPAAAFTDGAAISWQARGVDTDNTMAGGWSASCYLLVDNTASSPPGIASTDLALRVGLGIVPAAYPTAVVGRSATVTFTPAAADAGAIVGNRYGVAADADAVPTTWVAAGTGGAATAAVVPLPATFYNSVVVAAVKADGTNGSSTSAKFKANLATGATPHVLGDATGDGRADVTIASDVGAGKSALWRWNTTSSGSLSAVQAPQGNGGVYTNGQFDSASGDFDGDGLSDVATLTQSGSNVLLGVQRSDSNILLSIPVLKTLSGWSMSKVKMLAGDFDGDGKADVAALYDLGSAAWEYRVLLSTSTGAGNLGFADPAVWHAAAPGQSEWSRIKLAAGDRNGDGKTDVFQLYNYDNDQTKLWVNYSTGTSLQAGSLQWDSGPGFFTWGRAQFVAGDFTGDGKTDAGFLYDFGSGNISLLASTVKPDGSMTTWLTWWSAGANWSWYWGAVEPVTGDVNGDGKTDIALVYHCCGSYQARAWTATSTGSAFSPPVSQWSGALGPVGAGAVPPDNPAQKYQLVAQHSGKCLTVPGASTADNVRIQQQPCSATNQAGLFTLHLNGGGQYWIKPAHTTAKCLGVPGGPVTNGAEVDQNTCSAPWQNLNLHLIAGGLPGIDATVNIKPMYDSLCFDVLGGNTADGALLQQWTCNGNTQQLFALHPVA